MFKFFSKSTCILENHVIIYVLSLRETQQRHRNAPLAQLVEHLTLNQGVQGSSPWRCTQEDCFWRLRSSGDGSFFVPRNSLDTLTSC